MVSFVVDEDMPPYRGLRIRQHPEISVRGTLWDRANTVSKRNVAPRDEQRYRSELEGS
jgi:hypothetical protein